jgi:hypothetical protein
LTVALPMSDPEALNISIADPGTPLPVRMIDPVDTVDPGRGVLIIGAADGIVPFERFERIVADCAVDHAA